jgi:hypothetical protein
LINARGERRCGWGKGGEGRRKGAEDLMLIKCMSVIKEYIHIVYLLKIQTD